MRKEEQREVRSFDMGTRGDYTTKTIPLRIPTSERLGASIFLDSIVRLRSTTVHSVSGCTNIRQFLQDAMYNGRGKGLGKFCAWAL